MNRLLALLQDRIVIRLLAGAGLVVLIGQIVIWYPLNALHDRKLDGPLDFLVYQRSAARAAHGLTPYEPCTHGPELPPNCLLYPPPFTAVIALAGNVSPRDFQRGTYLVLLIAFWAFAIGLTKIALGRVRASDALIAGLLLILTPGLNVTMSFGNLDLVVWALVVWGLAAESTLPFLVVAAAFKIWPIFPLLVLVVEKGSRLRVAALTAAAILIATVAVLGPQSFADWRRLALPGLWAGTLVSDNVSLVAIAGRLGLSVPRPVLAALPLAAAFATWLTLRRRPERLRAIACGIAATICSPICWWYYAPVLLVPGALWLANRRAAPNDQ